MVRLCSSWSDRPGLTMLLKYGEYNFISKWLVYKGKKEPLIKVGKTNIFSIITNYISYIYKMNFTSQNVYHIYSQGNNKQPIFLYEEDYLIFLRMMRKCISPHSEVIGYCLMPNHFHFLIYTDDRVNTVVKQGGLLIDPMTNGIRKLLSGYARIFNKQYRKTGSLFRQKTKYTCLSDISISRRSTYVLQDYYFNCFHYIHQNPYRAGLVKKLEDWKFSSYKDYAQLRKGTLCNKDLAVKFCSYDPGSFIKTSYDIIPNDFTDEFL